MGAPPLWPLPRHMWWRFRKVAAFARIFVFGGFCVDMWRLVHQWWFLLFWLSQVYQDCINSVPTMYQSSKTVKRQSKQQKWPLVYQSSQVYHDCINSVPAVYQSSKTVQNSQKQSKDSQNSKNGNWCTNRHMSTKTVPTVYQSSKTVKYSQKTVKTAKMTIGVPIVTGLQKLYQQSTNSVPTVKNSQSTVKTA